MPGLDFPGSCGAERAISRARSWESGNRLLRDSEMGCSSKARGPRSVVRGDDSISRRRPDRCHPLGNGLPPGTHLVFLILCGLLGDGRFCQPISDQRPAFPRRVLRDLAGVARGEHSSPPEGRHPPMSRLRTRVPAEPRTSVTPPPFSKRVPPAVATAALS